MSGPGSHSQSPNGITPPSAGEPRLLASGYQGVVYLVEGPGGAAIVKRASGRGPLLALRRAMLRREYAIYQRLVGIAGIPACKGIGPDGELMLEFIRGHSLREAQPTAAQRERFFADLRDLILAMHRVGVAHGDLKRKDNILIGPGGRPYIIDFGTAIAAPPESGLVRYLLFRQMCRMDLNAWIKLKYRRQPGTLEPADRGYHRPTSIERIARVVRRAWRAATFRRWRNTRR